MSTTADDSIKYGPHRIEPAAGQAPTDKAETPPTTPARTEAMIMDSSKTRVSNDGLLIDSLRLNRELDCELANLHRQLAEAQQVILWECLDAGRSDAMTDNVLEKHRAKYGKIKDSNENSL